MTIKHLINDIFEDIITIRRHLHQHPELSEMEKETSDFICNHLKSLNIPYQANVAGYGVIATIEGTSKKKDKLTTYHTIGIRADMDAIALQEECPVSFASKNKGVMHACGHDMHTAILLGSAKILKELQAEFSGTVKLFFQPAEETVGGALQMIEAGCMENPKVDAVIGLHIHPGLETGKLEFFRGEMNAASTELGITVNGVACHGAHPDEGIDPILIASHIMLALQSISSRRLDPTTPGLLSIGSIHGGNAHNAIPSTVEMKGIIRAMSNDTRDFIKERVTEIATNTALAMGGSADIHFKDSYPALVNDLNLGAIIESVAEESLGKDAIIIATKPSLGADDFSYFSQAVPSVYFNIGACDMSSDSPRSLHNEHVNPDENALKIGMLMEVNSILKLLN